MAAQIDSTKPLHVKLVHLANGDTLEDKTVFILSGPLIVEADNPEQAPHMVQPTERRSPAGSNHTRTASTTAAAYNTLAIAIYTYPQAYSRRGI